MNIPHNNALIVEGGAMRSVFSAGVLDSFLNEHFNPFDFYLGVSAGAYNLLCYLTEEQNKSLKMFTRFAVKDEFINIRRFIRGGHLIDIDWIENIAFNPAHIKIHSAYQKNRPFYVCLTNVLTGLPVYINTNPANIQEIIKASAALPLLYRDYPVIDDQPMTDGGVADGIPVARAIELGARNICVIRARHVAYNKSDTLGHKLIRWKMRHYPKLVETMKARKKIYDDSIQLIRNPPPGVNIIEVCPPESFQMGRFGRHKGTLINGYTIGYTSALSAIQQWNDMCK